MTHRPYFPRWIVSSAIDRKIRASTMIVYVYIYVRIHDYTYIQINENKGKYIFLSLFFRTLIMRTQQQRRYRILIGNAIRARFKSEIDRGPVVTCRNPGSVSYTRVNSRPKRKKKPDEYITFPKTCGGVTGQADMTLGGKILGTRLDSKCRLTNCLYVSSHPSTVKNLQDDKIP